MNIRCKNCGLMVQVPVGGRRLCGCGAWLSGDEAMPVAEPIVEDDLVLAEASPAEPWPRIEGDLSAIERLNTGYRRIRKEMSKAIVGQEKVLEELLIAIFARGHCLLVGVPGLAKTLMIRTLADSLSLSFSRIQFTPDLMPSDITGTEVLQEDKTTGQRLFKFLHGPLFANVVLADEINRTPPKTQAALLEAMQERQVTVGGTKHKLPDPFFVLATQNPIEQEGTYPLPEAQQDRFMFNIFVDYPEEDEEFRIVEQTTTTHIPQLERVLSATDILEMQDIVRKVPVAPYVIRYAMKFTRLTRKGSRVASAEGDHDGARWSEAERSRGARLHPRLRHLGRWPAGHAVPHSRGQGPRRAARPLLRFLRGRARGRPAGAAPSHHHQLQRRGRGHQARRHRPPPHRPHSAIRTNKPLSARRRRGVRDTFPLFGREETGVDEADYWVALEFRVCREFAGMPENQLRFLWCDGFIPEQYFLAGPSPRITGRAWICNGRQQEEWGFTLFLNHAFSSPEDVEWQRLLPLDNVTRWLAVDLPGKRIQIESAAVQNTCPEP